MRVVTLWNAAATSKTWQSCAAQGKLVVGQECAKMEGKDLIRWMREVITAEASDLYVTVGAPPTMRGDDGFVKLEAEPLTESDLEAIIQDLATEEQQAEFQSELEYNLSATLGAKVGRFRVNLLRQRRNSAIVMRRITAEVPSLESLKLPMLLGELVREKRGLVLLVGGTGSGKSTTLAAMIDWRNRHEEGHILSIEDPIEYVHPHKLSLITQREVGYDTKSYDDALKNALRQKPDAILIGEIRDRSVMRHALMIAETGHLALSTLHANNADQAIDRIANFFDPEERRQALLNLSFNLRGIISQRLVRGKNGGRVLAMEVMLNLGSIPRMVRDGDTSSLRAEMRAHEAQGMLTFDRCLLGLLREGKIGPEVALAESDDRLTMAADIAALGEEA
jgi:twitching motility protein PilU